jgi:hypothetical protein
VSNAGAVGMHCLLMPKAKYLANLNRNGRLMRRLGVRFAYFWPEVSSWILFQYVERSSAAR